MKEGILKQEAHKQPPGIAINKPSYVVRADIKVFCSNLPIVAEEEPATDDETQFLFYVCLLLTYISSLLHAF